MQLLVRLDLNFLGYILWYVFYFIRSGKAAASGTVRNKNLTCSREVRFYKIHLWWNTRWVDKSAVTVNAEGQFGEDVGEAHTQPGLADSPQTHRGEPLRRHSVARSQAVCPARGGQRAPRTPRPAAPGGARAAPGSGGDPPLLGLSQRPAALGGTAAPLPKRVEAVYQYFPETSVLLAHFKASQALFPAAALLWQPLPAPPPEGARAPPAAAQPAASASRPHSRPRSRPHSPSHSRPLPVPLLQLNLPHPPPYCLLRVLLVNTGRHLE